MGNVLDLSHLFSSDLECIIVSAAPHAASKIKTCQALVIIILFFFAEKYFLRWNAAKGIYIYIHYYFIFYRFVWWTRWNFIIPWWKSFQLAFNNCLQIIASHYCLVKSLEKSNSPVLERITQQIHWDIIQKSSLFTNWTLLHLAWTYFYKISSIYWIKSFFKKSHFVLCGSQSVVEMT